MFLYLAGRKNTSYERSDFAQTDISCQIYFPKMLKILNDVGNFIIWRNVIMLCNVISSLWDQTIINSKCPSY